MSRSPEHLKELDWYTYARQEVARIPKFKKYEEEMARKIVDILENAYLDINSLPEYPYGTADLTYNGRQLQIEIWTEAPDFYAKSHLRKTESPKKKNDTTLLYLAAKVLFRSLADKHQRQVHYYFSTTVEKLKKWAKKTGELIFDWEEDKQENKPGEKEYFESMAVITPS